jgi:hypothetical protein
MNELKLTVTKVTHTQEAQYRKKNGRYLLPPQKRKQTVNQQRPALDNEQIIEACLSAVGTETRVHLILAVVGELPIKLRDEITLSFPS